MATVEAREVEDNAWEEAAFAEAEEEPAGDKTTKTSCLRLEDSDGAPAYA